MSEKRNLPNLKRRAVATNQIVSLEPFSPKKTLPLVAKPVADGVDLVAWATKNRKMIREELLTHGGILFRGFGLTKPGDLEPFIHAVSGDLLPYRERSSPRTKVTGDIYTSTEYPANQHIFLHNENSYQMTWPMKIFFHCVTPAEEGGETPIADCRAIYRHLSPTTIALFEEKGVRYLRNFSDSIGIPWQTVFQTEDKREVEAYCARNQIQPEWKPDGGLRTISIRGAKIRHPETGTPTWFNHGTFFHVSTLGSEIAETLQAVLPPEDLPTNTYFGDGTAIPDEILEELRTAYERERVSFPWELGDILMLDNMFTAHGRHPFKGARKILVGMSEPMTREQLAQGEDPIG